MLVNSAALSCDKWPFNFHRTIIKRWSITLYWNPCVTMCSCLSEIIAYIPGKSQISNQYCTNVVSVPVRLCMKEKCLEGMSRKECLAFLQQFYSIILVPAFRQRGTLFNITLCGKCSLWDGSNYAPRLRPSILVNCYKIDYILFIIGGICSH